MDPQRDDYDDGDARPDWGNVPVSPEASVLIALAVLAVIAGAAFYLVLLPGLAR